MLTRLCCVMLFGSSAVSMTYTDCEAKAQEKERGRGATLLKVVNATSERVEVRVNSALGNTTSFQFTGSGHFEPSPLSPGLGDRVASVRNIAVNGTVVLPSRVLTMSKFDPANANQPVLVLMFISGTVGYDIVYYAASEKSAGLGSPLADKDATEREGALSAEQKKSIEEILKKPALKAGGN